MKAKPIATNNHFLCMEHLHLNLTTVAGAPALI
jgi:hypothetical protein